MENHILRRMDIEPDKFFAALSHDLRLRMVVLLKQQGELCVCELTHALAVAQPTISRHLAQLRAAGVVEDRRDGLWIYYRVSRELPNWARQIIQSTTKGLADTVPFASDRQALEDISVQTGTAACT